LFARDSEGELYTIELGIADSDNGASLQIPSSSSSTPLIEGLGFGLLLVNPGINNAVE
jgi:hypothetical protein